MANNVAPTVTSRCLTFAEGAVTMVSPVLLALALKKDKWEKHVDKPDVPMGWLSAIAGATLFTGIFPTLACCASQQYPTWVTVAGLSDIRGCLATLSSLGLLFIACCISYVATVSKQISIILGALSLLPLIVRATTRPGDEPLPAEDPERRDAKKLHSMVDKSLEFASGITGILFLGLEGMALEGFVSEAAHRKRLSLHMTICSVGCVAGVFLIFLVMFPPRVATSARVHRSMHLTEGLMTVVTFALSTVIVVTLEENDRQKKVGFLVLLLPFCMILYLAFIITKNEGVLRQMQTQMQLPIGPGALPPALPATAEQEEAKPAPMGLIKVTFTGFLFVSVKAISAGSHSGYTFFFLLCAAAAIDIGVVWRLLTHTQNKIRVGGDAAAANAANVASFLTHSCVAIAVCLFAVEAWTGAAKDQSLDCAYVSNVTCVHFNKTSLDLNHTRNMCACIISNLSLSTGSFDPSGNCTIPKKIL